MLAPKDLDEGASSTASLAPSTAVEKMMPEPTKEDAFTEAPYRETPGDNSSSSLPSTVQAGLAKLDSTPPLAPTGPSFWRPGDKARLSINKKMRDIEFFLHEGALRMRDLSTGNVLTDRQKKPKEDLPEFDRNLLYHRLEPPGDVPQELAGGVGSSSRESIAKDKVTDSGTSLPFASIELIVIDPFYETDTRRETRKTAAQKNLDGERQLRSHSERGAMNGRGRGAPRGRR